MVDLMQLLVWSLINSQILHVNVKTHGVHLVKWIIL